MLLSEGPPPPEPLPHAKLEILLSFLLLKTSNALDDVFERAGGSPVVRHGGDLTTELKERQLLGLCQPHLLKNSHPLGFSQNIVVQGSFRNAISRAGLCKPQLLCDH